MKRKLWLASLIALACACALVLSGCGKTTIEELVRQDLETQFGNISADNEELISSIEAATGEDFATLGINAKDFLAAYLEGWKYEVGDIEVDDSQKTATGTVAFSCKPINRIIENVQGKIALELDAMQGMDEAAANQRAGELLLESVAEVEATEHSAELSYSKQSDGTWQAGEDALGAVSASMYD